ncbi:hypothetical protein [Adlercreutzia sp. ZJ473]|uniref:hypothetical protein n=1 Tax=Adlercreutzia sp. ZJ473 TaxID=2722822 RepID=UPI00155600C6|nr:hypothetical protein [Adlercreutzia sp. ZJ473]
MTSSFGDPLSPSQMEACAVLAMRMMLEDLATETGRAFDELLVAFASSNAYSMLFDFETRLWAEGPDYLRGVWEREIERNP